ncbi:hypothetical protein CBS115989_10512 [Aspergillus niger]|uniref:Contig An18c0010, genomic contig n=3 Tax=Aspergillus niger TaxID=5061 RepID=A2R9S9_ASPNC|nr:uncharacterized protein An18g00070 [Aspergillus niger]XP_025448285.1 mitochondrial carrier [Aspergillus niger CBS 101883]RDH14130.1 mitochondrial carrier [Aspergillus niger ATCC 13496]KAI2812374.1 hypothetical protein CBS115989_10512 [Aspergillus niger]KAI2835362.1 hypothetical protein CBS11232_10528 [Aspergillus niger]KAI2868685.1 hypothetical protein CBS115988_10553 [Aspergillus niger]KAI2870799.1 hypothetical protein CBS11852_11061 [Aspergillus niger]|eukprot:XP_001398478.1 tricarboxylate transport protein [Aspergillus niger CBS 513.88]
MATLASSTKPQKQYTPQWVSLIAGGVAGGVEAASTYPFEYAKTRVQLLRTSKSTPSNPLRLIFTVAQQEGVGALYTGCSTLIIGTTAKAAVRFVSYDTIKNALSDERGSLSPARGIVAGVVAGATESVLAVTPTERIKTALIDDAKNARQFRSSLHATQVLVRTHGLRELYRGLVSTTLKQSATSAVRMGTYNILKESFKAHDIPPTLFTTFCMGALAGVVTVYATQPFDTIKTRAQGVQGAGLVEAIRNIQSDYGVRGFWKGSSMRLGRLLLSGGIVFSVYEKMTYLLHSRAGVE